MTDAAQKKFNKCVRALARLIQAEADKRAGREAAEGATEDAAEADEVGFDSC